MTERPAQYGLEPRACPFVALAEDRDRRLDLPDPRHRCYAEPDPQPRAEAHQRAYCLSPAFAACPIFLDWAARAAADPIASRREAPTPAQLARPSDLGPSARPTDPASRPWAAPPPWTGDEQRPRPTPAGEQLAVFPEPGDGPDPDRDLFSEEPLRPTGQEAARSYETARPSGSEGDAMPVPHERSRESDDAALASMGREDSDAGRHAHSGDRSAALASSQTSEPSEPSPPAFLAGRERNGGIPPNAPIPEVPLVPELPRAPEPPRAPQGAATSRRSGPGGRPSQAHPAPVKRLDDRPEWIRSGGREAYPTLRTRVGLRHIPTALAALAGIAITVLSIYLLLGFLGQAGTNLPTVRPESPTPIASPTPIPSPSPVTYTVKSGDTLEAIAKSFGLTVDQVACANGITNPNELQVDQVLIIPDDEYECPVEGEPSPSS